MAARYEFWYSDDIGNRITYIDDVISFEYVLVLGGVGLLSVTLPKRGQVYDNSIPDRRITVYRQPLGSRLAREGIFMLRTFETTTSGEGLYQRKLLGYDLNELLNRRIVAFYAGESESEKTDYADDMMKEIVTENMIENNDYFGSPARTRSYSDYGLSVQSDSSAGDSIGKAFAWRNVLKTLQDLQADSKANGKEVFFGIVPTTETTMQFRTWISGRDRTESTGINPVIFSLEWGNLENPKLIDDFSDEENVIYAGGRGEKTERIMSAATSGTRVDATRLNRREAFAYSSGNDSATVATDARSRLELKRPTSRLYGNVLDTPLTPYGGDSGWILGDKVTISYAGIQQDVTVRAVHVKVNPNGDETITGKVEA